MRTNCDERKLHLPQDVFSIVVNDILFLIKGVVIMSRTVMYFYCLAVNKMKLNPIQLDKFEKKERKSHQIFPIFKQKFLFTSGWTQSLTKSYSPAHTSPFPCLYSTPVSYLGKLKIVHF